MMQLNSEICIRRWEYENELLKQIEERTSKIHTICGEKTTQMVYPLSECNKNWMEG